MRWWREQSRAFGSWLLGRPGEPVRVLQVRLLLLGVPIVVANIIGAVSVFVLAAFVIPGPSLAHPARLVLLNLLIAAAYTGAAVAIGVLWGVRGVLKRAQWAFEQRPPTANEQRATLGLSLRLMGVQAAFWAPAVIIFGIFNGVYDSRLWPIVAPTVLIGGTVTSANAYLLSEFALRPLAARALASGPPERLPVPGVRARTLLAWGLGSGLPVLGLMFVAIATLAGQSASSTRLSVTILALGAIVLVFGLFVTDLAARANADPIRGLRVAAARVERGELDVEVPIYDGTEIGLLQAGFNRMASGLRERERIRDLFGRHVGEDVAHRALEGEIELGGEVREVAVLFVDIIGSTNLAASRPPSEVVDLLNRFFAIVVDVVSDHGGLINKFEGDAALAVFGAPIGLDDDATHALAAGRELAERLRGEIEDCAAGIGIAAGPAVAGNIGEKRRYEYTVIGDPVNEAARLTELAKTVPERLAASATALERASEGERERWKLGKEVVLRGRSAPTRVATPV
jgi:adenylate cyclase